jgi:acetylornithine/succinyldiaminopimelate/putrescine aminotransferase
VTAAAKAVLTSLLNEGRLAHCSRMGDYFRNELERLKANHPVIKEIRGLGLMVGVELEEPGAPVVEGCLERGFLINCAQEKVLRFVPPLIVGKKEIDGLIHALDEVLK